MNLASTTMPAGPSRVIETLPAWTLRLFASAPDELCGLKVVDPIGRLRIPWENVSTKAR